MHTTEPSKIIIRDGGKGPFAHTLYPVGGFKTSAEANRRTVKDASDQIQQTLDEVPPIEPAENSSIGSNRKISPQSAVSETIVTFPPTDKILKTSTMSCGKDQPPAENVRRFLMKIPDLSYMLSSKLSIPTGK
jgi:hypothetical protein